MTDFDSFTARTTRRSLGVFTVALLASVVSFRADFRVAAGLALGFAVGLAVFHLKAKAALTSVGKTKKSGTAFLIGRHYLNFAAYGLVLGFAFKTGKVNGWAALAGLLVPNAVMILGALRAGHVEAAATPKQTSE